MTSKNKPIILIDTREKSPLNFDGDSAFADIEYTALQAGDYALKGLENFCVIERKAGADELLNNFMYHRKRIYAEIERLSDCKHKFIVIEQELEQIMTPISYFINRSGKNKQSPKVAIGIVMSNLIELIMKYNVHIIFAGSKARSIVKRILLWTHKTYA